MCGLQDLGFVGHCFTWSNKQSRVRDIHETWVLSDHYPLSDGLFRGGGGNLGDSILRLCGSKNLSIMRWCGRLGVIGV